MLEQFWDKPAKAEFTLLAGGLVTVWVCRRISLRGDTGDLPLVSLLKFSQKYAARAGV